MCTVEGSADGVKNSFARPSATVAPVHVSMGMRKLPPSDRWVGSANVRVTLAPASPTTENWPASASAELMILGPLPWGSVPKSRFLTAATDKEGVIVVVTAMFAALF